MVLLQAQRQYPNVEVTLLKPFKTLRPSEVGHQVITITNMSTAPYTLQRVALLEPREGVSLEVGD
jgi:hypothetical protein